MQKKRKENNIFQKIIVYKFSVLLNTFSFNSKKNKKKKSFSYFKKQSKFQINNDDDAG